MTQVQLRYDSGHNVDNAILWCKDRFGSCVYNKSIWNYIGMGEFEFQREEDAILFTLRWA